MPPGESLLGPPSWQLKTSFLGVDPSLEAMFLWQLSSLFYRSVSVAFLFGHSTGARSLPLGHDRIITLVGLGLGLHISSCRLGTLYLAEDELIEVKVGVDGPSLENLEPP
jgi:hypothetical protein